MKTENPKETESTDSKSDFNRLQRFVQEELEPAITDLALAKEAETVDEHEAYATFLLRAAEGGSLAEDILLSGGDARDRALRHAREATFAAASLVGEDDPEGSRAVLAEDTRRLATAVEDLAPGAEIEHPEGYDGDDRDEKWLKHAPASFGSIKLEPYIYVDLDAPEDDLETCIQLYPSDPGEVNLGFTTTGSNDGQEIRLGSITDLTPDQAESLAAALVKSAEKARQQQGGSR